MNESVGTANTQIGSTIRCTPRVAMNLGTSQHCQKTNGHADANNNTKAARRTFRETFIWIIRYFQKQSIAINAEKCGEKTP